MHSVESTGGGRSTVGPGRVTWGSPYKLFVLISIPFILLILPLLLGKALAGGSSTRILAVDLRHPGSAAQIAAALNQDGTPRPERLIVIYRGTAGLPCSRGARTGLPAYCATLNSLSTSPVFVNGATGATPLALLAEIYGPSVQDDPPAGGDVYVADIPGRPGFSLSAALLVALIMSVVLAAFGFWFLGRANPLRRTAEAQVGPGTGTGSGSGWRPEQDSEPLKKNEKEPPLVGPPLVGPPVLVISLAERMRRLAGASATARSPIDQSGGYAEVDGLILWSVPAAGFAASPQVFSPGDELYVVDVDEATKCLKVASRHQETRY
jgi:hypothetical protein